KEKYIEFEKKVKDIENLESLYNITRVSEQLKYKEMYIHLREIYENTINSKSWKLTAPLRKMMKIFK
ncbi:MAG: hypothetical protein K6A23_14640, partial [Butyrivibrio sp.]|nr:hypothetical protein [Butyrivibrio sp.]